ncbi:MAG: glycosyltransferase family 2 protein [Thermomicrobiaceae bacterium]
MISQIRALKRGANLHWPWTFAFGLILVGLFNLRAWKQGQREWSVDDGEREVHTPRELPDYPKVSVLVAAWNEARHVDNHIDSFLALSYPTIELIICAGGTDDTLRRARKYASESVIVIEQGPGEGKQKALARCLEYASGEIIYLTDADCVFRDDTLISAIAPLIIEGEHAATGSSRPLDYQREMLLPSHLWASEVVVGMRHGRYIDGLLGRNAAVTRDALNNVGGLDFPAPTGTDYHLARRLAANDIAIRYVGTSVVRSEYPETIGEYRSKQSRWLRNLLIYGAQYGAKDDVASTRRTVTTGLIMTLMPLSAIVVGRIALVTWGILLIHAVCARVRYMLLAVRLDGRAMSPRYSIAVSFITLLDFIVWALPAVEMLDSRRRTQW